MQLNEIRKELKFNIELVQLIETLKSIASTQYMQMEKQKERFDRFMDAFSGFFRVVDLVDVDHPLVRASSDVLGIIIVTSDSGFMGGLNQGVIRAALNAQGEVPNEKTSLVILGDKGSLAFSDSGRPFKFFKGVVQETIYEQAVEVKDYVVNEIKEGRMGKLIVAYPRPLSFSSQTIEVINILPCAELFDRHAQSEIADHATDTSTLAETTKGTVVIESSFEDMLEYLASTWVISKLYEVFEDSKLAEFSARTMHLEGSMQTLEKDLKRVKHQAFKAAHEKIDKGMRESFAAGGKARRKRSTKGKEAA